MIVEHAITPEQVRDVLRGIVPPGLPSGEIEVRCDEVPIARICNVDDVAEVSAIACAHPRHGTSPAFRALADRLTSLGIRPEGVCPVCQGAVWLKPSDDAARVQVVWGLTFGLYRGISIPHD
jgi:hypothetical protein